MQANEFEIFQSLLESYISKRLPECVRSYSCQISKDIVLPEREKEIVKKAIAKRVNEFSAGRLCARKCLSFFGIENFELLQGKFGEPLWPDGFTGSITHHSGIALAVSMPLDQGYIGIDIVDLAEDLPNPAAVLNDIELEIGVGEVLQNRELLLFSLKESVIKILSPLLAEYVEFKDIEINFSSKVGKVKFRGEFLNIDLFSLCHGQCAITIAIMKF